MRGERGNLHPRNSISHIPTRDNSHAGDQTVTMKETDYGWHIYYGLMNRSKYVNRSKKFYNDLRQKDFVPLPVPPTATLLPSVPTPVIVGVTPRVPSSQIGKISSQIPPAALELGMGCRVDATCGPSTTDNLDVEEVVVNEEAPAWCEEESDGYWSESGDGERQ
ncbi:hypothetical protein V2J09_000885 [Rumex salicifolius]